MLENEDRSEEEYDKSLERSEVPVPEDEHGEVRPCGTLVTVELLIVDPCRCTLELRPLDCLVGALTTFVFNVSVFFLDRPGAPPRGTAGRREFVLVAFSFLRLLATIVEGGRGGMFP